MIRLNLIHCIFLCQQALGELVTPNAELSISQTLDLKVGRSPPVHSQVIDGTFQSFSIEYCYMADYAGNLR